MSILYCRECQEWVTCETDGPWFFCSECSEPILCDECGSLWETDHQCEAGAQ